MYYDVYPDIFSSLTHFIRIPISHFIASKNYDETITTIRMCKAYDATFSRERESNHQQVKKNKRILLVDDEYDVNLAMKLVLEEKGFKVDSFTNAVSLSFFRTEYRFYLWYTYLSVTAH